jgi:hypothetical protein
LQPYNRGNRELLAVLHRLDNLDKHRFPPLVAGAARVAGLDVAGIPVSNVIPQRLGALEDGAPILEFMPLPYTQMEMHLQYAGTVAFDKRSTVAAGQPVIDLLTAIRAFIRDEVFPKLEPFLD